MHSLNDTIFAPATPPGLSALAIVRISGPEAIEVASRFFRSAGEHSEWMKAASQTAHFGSLFHGDDLLDEVVLTIFRAPRSYTGQNLVEISCHGNPYIVQRLCEMLTEAGARMADAGEFTLRAFLNGKFDLSQAEAVADLIAARSPGSHALALKQMRGGYSEEIRQMRTQLLDFASLITLELDFSEEDVEFADRSKLLELLDGIHSHASRLIASFSTGRVIRSGIPVAITGKPNVGKSTLLNAILNEERAIVSEIPGTTRDSIEDTIVVNGLAFRFIDTAGLRTAGDALEQIGMLRAIEKIAEARIVLYVVDISQTSVDEINARLNELRPADAGQQKTFIVIANKTDLLTETPPRFAELMQHEVIFVSARRKENIQLITESLLRAVGTGDISDRTLVSNARHHEALLRTREAVEKARQGLQQGLSGDLLSVEINQALYHLGLISGEITTEEMLSNIFGKFCIGK